MTIAARRPVVPAPAPIPFVDLEAQQRRLGRRIDDAIARVLAHRQFVLGPEIAELEKGLSEFCGAKEAMGCASGTDALSLVLMAKNVGPGDAVFCPSFTFAATAEAVALLGATPVFVDIEADTYNMDAASLEQAIATARRQGVRPVGIVAVDLFGHPADYGRLGEIADGHGLWIVADAAQSFGATYQGRKVGTLGIATTTSFFPAKPLGCYGDGGAIFTDDADLAAIIRSLRNHGAGADRYDNVRIGINGRLDTIQAAILIEKLAIFADELAARDAAAQRYNALLEGHVHTPRVQAGCTTSWAVYTIRVDGGRRDRLAAALREQGIPTAIYYPKPLHQQTAYRGYPVAGNGLPVSERVADEVLSLPIHAYLAPAVQERIAGAIVDALNA